MRGCLLKYSSEQVRKATDAEWLGAELSRTLATEVLNSRQRSGQRGFVDVELEGQPTEEPPADTRPHKYQVFGAAAPVSDPFASIAEETDVVNGVVPQAMETWLQTRPRQPESEPGSEPGVRNIRPRAVSESNEHRMDGNEERQPSTATEGDVLEGAAGATTSPERRSSVSTPSHAPTINLSQTLSYSQTSASIYMTVLPCETGFDSKAQAIVHGSVDALPKQDPITFEASNGMAVFDNETRSYWVAPKPKDKSGVVYDELSSEDKKLDAARFKEVDNLLNLGALSLMTATDSDHFAKTPLENVIPLMCWTNGNVRMKAS